MNISYCFVLLSLQTVIVAGLVSAVQIRKEFMFWNIAGTHLISDKIARTAKSFPFFALGAHSIQSRKVYLKR